ncbi:MAG: helix-turn-helix domain-containing protein [Caldilineaceae bacterium]
MEKTYLTIAQAVEYSGKGKRTIYRWIEQGKLKAYQNISKVWMIDKNDLDEALNRLTPNKPDERT